MGCSCLQPIALRFEKSFFAEGASVEPTNRNSGQMINPPASRHWLLSTRLKPLLQLFWQKGELLSLNLAGVAPEASVPTSTGQRQNCLLCPANTFSFLHSAKTYTESSHLQDNEDKEIQAWKTYLMGAFQKGAKLQKVRNILHHINYLQGCKKRVDNEKLDNKISVLTH